MVTTSNDVDDDGDSNDNDANDNDGGNGDNNDGEVECDGGDNDDNNNDNDVNIHVIEDDDDDGTTTMRWRRGRMDDDDAMAMGGQRHAECSRAPRHPSEATINLCRQFWEESMRVRDNFGGGRQKRVEVEEIEWRSLHLHSINSKPTFQPPQFRERPEPIPHVSWK